MVQLCKVYMQALKLVKSRQTAASPPCTNILQGKRLLKRTMHCSRQHKFVEVYVQSVTVTIKCLKSMLTLRRNMLFHLKPRYDKMFNCVVHPINRYKVSDTLRNGLHPQMFVGESTDQVVSIFQCLLFTKFNIQYPKVRLT